MVCTEKRWPAIYAFGVVRRNARHQFSLRHLLHLFQELTLVGLLEIQIKVQTDLFRKLYFFELGLQQPYNWRRYAEFS